MVIEYFEDLPPNTPHAYIIAGIPQLNIHIYKVSNKDKTH